MLIDFVRASRALAGASLFACLLGACAEPLQNGGVVVFGGASARFDAMCRFRRGSEGSASSCSPSSAEVPRATAMRIANESQLVKGSRAEGSVGDVLLTNGEISMIVGGQSSAKPGVVLDVLDARVGRDELLSLASCVAEKDDCLTLAAPEFGQERDGSAWVEVRLAGQTTFDARTRYTLLPGARSFLVSTIVSTQSVDPLSLSRIGDVVTWGASQPIVPPGESPPFVASVGTDVAYAIVPADDRSSVSVDASESPMFVRHARDVAVSVGHPVRRDRAFVVAPRGDTLGVLTEVALLRDGQAPGAIDVKFVGPDGLSVSPPAGGRVRVLAPSFPIDGYLAILSTPEGLTAAGEAPPGRYELDFEGSGRRAATRVPVEVRSGEVTQVTLSLVESGLAAQTP